MLVDPAVGRRTLAIAVNARTRCGLDPMLVGNIITTLNFDLRRGETAGSIAERIRHHVDHFADEHCDMRINQQLLDAAGAWRAARCVSTAFDPARWNPLITNLSGFGVYRVQFEDTFTSYCTPLMKLPVAGLGALVDGADGRGLVFQMPCRQSIQAMSCPAIREHLHRFRRAGDDIPRLHREHPRLMSTGSQHLDGLQPSRMDHRIHRGGQDEYEYGCHAGPQRQRQHTPFDLDAVVTPVSPATRDT